MGGGGEAEREGRLPFPLPPSPRSEKPDTHMQAVASMQAGCGTRIHRPVAGGARAPPKCLQV